jgi:Molybdenum cofactor biosynthesis enzyme
MIIIPSLVINITDKCNFSCKYCPPYGENLSKGEIEYDIQSLYYVINIMHKKGGKVLRFTGGEPLLERERLYKLLEYSNGYFERTIINTNGYYLSECLNDLQKYIGKIVIKVSLDSLDDEEFHNISNTCYSISKIIDAIDRAIQIGHNIELNTVLTTQSIKSIKKIISFCKNRKINLKLLSQASFYDKLDIVENQNIDDVVNYLNIHMKKLNSERLITNLGVSMLKYQNDQSQILLIDHRTKDSYTPNKLFFQNCQNQCVFFPCDSGVFSISVSTDGIITPCRGRKDLGNFIFKKTKSDVERSVLRLLSYYSNCQEININC